MKLAFLGYPILILLQWNKYCTSQETSEKQISTIKQS